jgi:hypothetical protein
MMIRIMIIVIYTYIHLLPYKIRVKLQLTLGVLDRELAYDSREIGFHSLCGCFYSSKVEIPFISSDVRGHQGRSIIIRITSTSDVQVIRRMDAIETPNGLKCASRVLSNNPKLVSGYASPPRTLF